MEIRPIRPEEKIDKDKIQAIAFLFKKDFDEKEADAARAQEGYQTGRAAFDDSGKMCSCLDLIPFEVRFDGNTIPMGGIGGVASLPEEREKKYIRRIFEFIMKEMYEKGTVFSYLYPFSHVYYRKFGYELNMTTIRYSIPLPAFRHFRQNGSIRLHTHGMDTSVIEELYAKYIQDKNLTVLRTEKLWKKFLEKDPYKDNVFLYIWYNQEGVPGGYLQFQAEKQPGGKNLLQVRELIWTDSEALLGIFGFIGGLTAQMERMVWDAPSFLNLLPLFPEPYEVKQEIFTYGMNRIVNAEKALGLISVPNGSGELVIGVEDGFFPINSGNYRIAWENGSVSVNRSQQPPDLNCDVQSLSQLITGFASAEELEFAHRIEIKGKKDTLSQLFPGKKLFINNYF